MPNCQYFRRLMETNKKRETGIFSKEDTIESARRMLLMTHDEPKTKNYIAEGTISISVAPDNSGSMDSSQMEDFIESCITVKETIYTKPKKEIPGDFIYTIRRKDRTRRGYIIGFVEPRNPDLVHVGYMLCRDGDRFNGQWAIEAAKKRGLRLDANPDRANEDIPFTIRDHLPKFLVEIGNAPRFRKKNFPMWIVKELNRVLES